MQEASNEFSTLPENNLENINNCHSFKLSLGFSRPNGCMSDWDMYT